MRIGLCVCEYGLREFDDAESRTWYDAALCSSDYLEKSDSVLNRGAPQESLSFNTVSLHLYQIFLRSRSACRTIH